MAYSTAEGRQQLLDELADAIDELGYALADLGAAYEQLDVMTADKLEEQLFGPLQRGYGRAKRTYAAFAERAGLEAQSFDTPEPGPPPSTGPKGFVASASAAIGKADLKLGDIQDSSQLIEVGDAELRAGLVEIRTAIGGLPQAASEITRRLGR
jgi:tetrahydromethanopterin S-methyltransferase subunit F